MAFKFAVLGCLLAFANASPLSVETPFTPRIGLNLPNLQNRVVGGDDAKEGQFPHQVSLQYNSLLGLTHFCGGSILNEQWILTAGHCVKASPGFPITVKAGKHNIKKVEKYEQTSAVESSHIHESYSFTEENGGVAPFDIALLKLKTKLNLNDRVAAIALPESGSEPVGTATVSGWGSISKTFKPVRPNILQTVDISLVDRQACNASIIELSNGVPSPLHETNICTGPLSGGLGTCRGDSGGPLIAEKENGSTELIGVVSWGFVPCGFRGAPSVFVKVSDFVDWINNKIAN